MNGRVLNSNQVEYKEKIYDFNTLRTIGKEKSAIGSSFSNLYFHLIDPNGQYQRNCALDAAMALTNTYGKVLNDDDFMGSIIDYISRKIEGDNNYQLVKNVEMFRKELGWDKNEKEYFMLNLHSEFVKYFKINHLTLVDTSDINEFMQFYFDSIVPLSDDERFGCLDVKVQKEKFDPGMVFINPENVQMTVFINLTRIASLIYDYRYKNESEGNDSDYRSVIRFEVVKVFFASLLRDVTRSKRIEQLCLFLNIARDGDKIGLTRMNTISIVGKPISEFEHKIRDDVVNLYKDKINDRKYRSIHKGFSTGDINKIIDGVINEDTMREGIDPMELLCLLECPETVYKELVGLDADISSCTLLKMKKHVATTIYFARILPVAAIVVYLCGRGKKHFEFCKMINEISPWHPLSGDDPKNEIERGDVINFDGIAVLLNISKIYVKDLSMEFKNPLLTSENVVRTVFRLRDDARKAEVIERSETDADTSADLQ